MLSDELRIAAVQWRLIWQCCTAPGVPRRSLMAAIVVGTILNLINQGDALFGGRPINWLKLVLTYIVPYCVATYGAVAFRLEAMRKQRPSAD
jgi:hypothetical protein